MKSIICGSCGIIVTNSDIEKHVAEKHFGGNPAGSGGFIRFIYSA